MQLEHEANQQHQASLVLNVPELIANRLRTAVQLRTSLALGTGLVQSLLHSSSSSNGHTAPTAATSQAASANGTEASSASTATSNSTNGAESVVDSSSDRQASGSQASTSRADSRGSSVPCGEQRGGQTVRADSGQTGRSAGGGFLCSLG